MATHKITLYISDDGDDADVTAAELAQWLEDEVRQMTAGPHVDGVKVKSIVTPILNRRN